MTNGRLWYPQLDVFDCIRRLGALLKSFGDPPGVERLFIADFYLANPPLLHRTKMSQSTRKAFNDLSVPRPEKTFLSYPAAPLLFHKMEPIQKEALRAMAGKGLISMEEVHLGVAELTDRGYAAFEITQGKYLTQTEVVLVNFLTKDFAVSVEAGSGELRRSTGLRRVR